MMKMRVTPSMAFRIIMKYWRNATITDAPTDLPATRYAPTSTTAVSPRFSTSDATGLLIAVTAPALVSVAYSASLTRAKRARS